MGSTQKVARLLCITLGTAAHCRCCCALLLLHTAGGSTFRHTSLQVRQALDHTQWASHHMQACMAEGVTHHQRAAPHLSTQHSSAQTGSADQQQLASSTPFPAHMDWLRPCAMPHPPNTPSCRIHTCIADWYPAGCRAVTWSPLKLTDSCWGALPYPAAGGSSGATAAAMHASGDSWNTHCKGFRQQALQALAPGHPLLELLRLGTQLIVA